MAIIRTLAGLTLAATATLALTAQTAHAASASWGPYHAPGHAARAAGTLTVRGEDHADLPTADSVRVSGKVQDDTRGAACGWAVFRVTYRSGNELPHREHWARDCSYRTPKRFSFTFSDVYQVELKVCAERKAAKPSLNCLYAGTWKTLYLSK
ncbi:hypothetical protein [Nonomuraea gerenzanensis]|uniref:Secreted protein n=1 Tax=Nonomuraea gerenzanensis TaxID=93944 RepID=A0A1M4EQV3_9ACTN|nr:hypothetical protein [Nonomuraea gerenzanensis]UBU12654.1 hypothetical protein LCN96_51765 [Nonomuraea gerenzanensis]SBP01210.1 hypothetical protein BN4615_P10726 [Nonomuraea gerenzanensis]